MNTHHADLTLEDVFIIANVVGTMVMRQRRLDLLNPLQHAHSRMLIVRFVAEFKREGRNWVKPYKGSARAYVRRKTRHLKPVVTHDYLEG